MGFIIQYICWYAILANWQVTLSDVQSFAQLFASSTGGSWCNNQGTLCCASVGCVQCIGSQVIFLLFYSCLFFVGFEHSIFRQQISLWVSIFCNHLFSVLDKVHKFSLLSTWTPSFSLKLQCSRGSWSAYLCVWFLLKSMYQPSSNSHPHITTRR